MSEMYFLQDSDLVEPYKISRFVDSQDSLEVKYVDKGILVTRRAFFLQNLMVLSNNTCINLKNIYLERLDQGQLVLKKGRQQLLFQGDVNSLEEKLKRYVIQTNYALKYKTLNQIGHGHNSKVFKIKNRKTQELYAAKVIKKNIRDKNLLVNEVNILRELNHKNVMRYIEAFESAGSIILVFELCQGGDLLGYLMRCSKLEEAKCKLILRQVLEGIVYLHSLGIFHRDIKPDNIFLRHEDDLESICLGDFGLAEYYQTEGNYILKRCGTPGYTAPEILRDLPYDCKIDVFSCGILFYILLTGRQAFVGENSDKMIENNAKGFVEINSLEFPQQTKSYLQQLLLVNSKDRISSKEALMSEYFGYKRPRMSIQVKKLPSLQKIKTSVHSPSPCSTKSFEDKSFLSFRIKKSIFYGF